jgi:hypothetical protein
VNVIINMFGHPGTRMRERGITRADIENALGTCFAHTPGHNGGGCHVGYGVGGTRELKVWTVQASLVHTGDIVVKSAAWKGV